MSASDDTNGSHVANMLGWLIVAVVFLAGYQFADIFGLLPS